jgi:hypothetical protein
MFHYDADRFFFDEGFDVSDDIAMVELLHEFDLFEDLFFGLCGAVLEADFLGGEGSTLITYCWLSRVDWTRKTSPKLPLPILESSE